jgi:hypothetical protein
LAIHEKALGADHPTTKLFRSNLQALIFKEPGKKTEK